MQEVFKAVEKIAGVNFPVLLEGETGVGKELLAKVLHYTSPRKDAPFVATTCAAIPDNLLSAELFGVTKGAFTGAEKDRKGLFEQANGGTLFLDDIDTMSIPMQESLLRVLQEFEVRPLGSQRVIKVDVRLICACNEKLSSLVEEGLFRKDLYFRIAALRIRIPPLRERLEDLPLLVEELLERITKESLLPRKSITQRALSKLARHPWPGNIRELENVLKEAVILCEGNLIDQDDIRLSSLSQKPSGEILTVDEYIRSVLEKYSSTMEQKEIAKRLGISRKVLWEKRKRWGLVK
jgi:two-component system response regulator PilR (NtrC family)